MRAEGHNTSDNCSHFAAGEYWGRWHLKADRVHVEGTKRAGRVCDIPLVRSPAVPRMHRRTFEDGVRARSRDLTPYDLRRTYANWLEAAGIPRTRRRLYLGHGAGDVTDLYETHEVTAFLADDAQRLRTYVAPESRAKSHGFSHGRPLKKRRA
jgi:integrase